MSAEEVVEFDDFASDEEEELEEEYSDDIPDELIIQPSKKVAKDSVLQEFPKGLIYNLNVFCEKCKTLYTVRLDAAQLTESNIAHIHMVEWKSQLVMIEDVAEQDQEDAIEEKVDIVQLAPAIQMLAAVESKKSTCLSPDIHAYMKTKPEEFRALEAKRQAQTLLEQKNNLSFLLSTLAMQVRTAETHTFGYLYLSEATIEQVDAKIKKHKTMKKV